MDISRFQLECMEMTANSMFRRFSLFEDTNYSKTNPARYFWKGRLSDREICVKYTCNHPHEPMQVFITPKLDTHHDWGDGSLCFLKPHEWSPNFTAATVIGIVFRFLDEFSKGRTE